MEKKRIVFYAVFCDDKIIERFPITTDILKVIEGAKTLKNQGHKVSIKKYKVEINHIN